MLETGYHLEMPTETRRILFTNEELLNAIARHRRDDKQPLPQSRIRGIKAERNGHAVNVAILLSAGDGHERLEIRPEEVAASLIKYCALQKIPLPRRAQKSIAVEGGQVELHLQLPPA